MSASANKKACFSIICTIFLVFFADVCFANTADTDIISNIVKKFNEQADKWFTAVQEFALNLFYWIAVLEVVFLGIRVSISGTEIKETLQQFVMMLLASGFFLACINNYKEWTGMIFRGLSKLAGEMTTMQNASDYPFLAGLELVKTITDKIGGFDVGLMLVSFLASLVIMICFALITAKMILIKCEVIIAMMAALILVPLGASKFFREYAINTLRYIFSVAFKLFTMQLVIGIGFSFINDIKISDANITSIAIIIGFAVVLLAISQTIPETVAGIVNGSHVGSGGGLMAAAKGMGGAMVGAGAMAAGAVMGGVTAGKAINAATKIAKSEGAQGFMGIAKGAGKALMSARSQTNMEKNRTSIGGALQERLASINQMK